MAAPHALAAAYAGVEAAVFGATGFIGRHVCRALVAHGARPVLMVRDRVSGTKLGLELGVAPERVVACDVEDPAAVMQVVRELCAPITFNLAGYGVDRGERDEARAFRINARFVETLCAAIASTERRDWPGLRLVHAGTQLEYGPVGGVVHEALDARPDTAYGRSKLEAARALEAWGRSHALACIAARLFTVYGPGEHRGRLLPALIETAATRRPLELTSGAQRLDFTYVEDVAEGLLRLGVTSAPPGAVVNLARGEIVAVRDFVEQAAEILDIPHDLLRFGARADRPEEMRYSGVSNQRLRDLTNWSPPTTVAGGIRRTLEWSNRSNAFA